MRRIFHSGKTYLALVTFILILATGIIFKQSVFRMIPLCSSLIIMLLSTTANRYGFLLGGINSAFYGAVFIGMGLYGTAINALAVSMPMQILTYIAWSRKKYKHSTVLRRLSNKARIILFVVIIAVWLTAYAILSFMGSGYIVFDNTVLILGTVGSILSFLSYVEYAFFGLVSQPISLIMNIMVMRDDPSHITYVIFSVYSLICTVLSFKYLMKLYAFQQKEKELTENEKHC